MIADYIFEILFVIWLIGVWAQIFYDSYTDRQLNIFEEDGHHIGVMFWPLILLFEIYFWLTKFIIKKFPLIKLINPRYAGDWFRVRRKW